MAYKVSFEEKPTIAVKLSVGDNTNRVGFNSTQYVNAGKRGLDGTTFYPEVSGEDCTLSWTNDGGKENPAPVNIRGKQGEKGEPGSATLEALTNLDLEKLLV